MAKQEKNGKVAEESREAPPDKTESGDSASANQPSEEKSDPENMQEVQVIAVPADEVPDWLRDDYVPTGPDVASDVDQVMRKTGVAVAGTTVTAVGLVMIPLPTPFGCVIAGGGMALLGTEFPAAQRCLEGTCNNLADAIEKKVEAGELKDKNKERKKKQNRLERSANNLGKKAAPVIRKIGEGVEKEKLEEGMEKVGNGFKNIGTVLVRTTQNIKRTTQTIWNTIVILVQDNQRKLHVLKQEKLETEVMRMQAIVNAKVREIAQEEENKDKLPKTDPGDKKPKSRLFPLDQEESSVPEDLAHQTTRPSSID